MRSKSISGLNRPHYSGPAALCLFILLLFTEKTVLFCQEQNPSVMIYNTYEDYLRDSGKFIGKLVDFKKNYWDSYSLKTDDGSYFSLKGIWGFKVGDTSLFRVIGVGTPIFVWSQGNFVYYEHGRFHLTHCMMGEKIPDPKCTYRYFSDDLKGFVESSESAYAKKNPDFRFVLDCYLKFSKTKNQLTDMENFRSCIRQFKP